MNKTKVFILSLFVMFIATIAAAFHVGGRVRNELFKDYNAITAEISVFQDQYITEANVAQEARTLVSPKSMVGSVENLMFTADTVGRITPVQLLRNTLAQRTVRASVAIDQQALKDLQDIVVKNPKLQKDVNVKNAIDNLKYAIDRNNTIRLATKERIKVYNNKFDSLIVTIIASPMGYHKLPIEIM